jgi:hypothetical protein
VLNDDDVLFFGAAAAVAFATCTLAVVWVAHERGASSPPPAPPRFAWAEAFEELAGAPEGGAAVCAICLEQDGGRLILPCGHGFHRGCVLSWFERRVTCPLCARDPRTPPLETPGAARTRTEATP